MVLPCPHVSCSSAGSTRRMCAFVHVAHSACDRQPNANKETTGNETDMLRRDPLGPRLIFAKGYATDTKFATVAVV